MGDEASYERRIAGITRRGVARRLGGRWGGFTLLVPALGSGFAAMLIGGNDPVTANGALVTLLSSLAGLAIWTLIVGFWSAIHAPAEEDARVRSERDAAERQLAARLASTGLASAEIAKRLSEGNDLVRILTSYRRPVGPRPQVNPQLTEWRREQQEEVKAWAARCRRTVLDHLPDDVWSFDQALPRPARTPIVLPGTPLLHEVTVRMERLERLQHLARTTTTPAPVPRGSGEGSAQARG